METENNKNISSIQQEQLTQQDSKGIIAQYTRIRAFSTPLPPPDYLEVYERLSPGVTDRILKMAEKQWDLTEKQIDNRMKEENKMIDSSIKNKWGGFIIGSIALFAILGIGFVLALKGMTWLAGILFTTTILGIPAIFVLGQVPNKKK